VLSLCFGAGIRLLMRALSSWFALDRASGRAAILGGGEAGELAILICRRRGINAYPVVVLESDPVANYKTVHGVPVRSVDGDPVPILRQARAEILIVPSGPELRPADRDFLDRCRVAGVRIVQLEVPVTPNREASIRSLASALFDSASEPETTVPTQA